MRLRGIATALLLAGCTTPAVAAPQPADLRDYALAACLIRQPASRALQTEGYRLAQIVLTRAAVAPAVLKPLDTAVAAALAGRGMLMVHVDGPVATASQAAPLASCLVAIERPGVRRAAQALLARGRR